MIDLFVKGSRPEEPGHRYLHFNDMPIPVVQPAGATVLVNHQWVTMDVTDYMDALPENPSQEDVETFLLRDDVRADWLDAIERLMGSLNQPDLA